MRQTVPAKLYDKMVPTYPPGCKRIIVDPNYLAALHQPNVDLNWTAIQEIVEDGVVLKTGDRVPLDVIIFGTGFYLVERDITFRGIGGLTLKQYFESEGGATGYYGTVFPGFPNMFTIVGQLLTGFTQSAMTSPENSDRTQQCYRSRFYYFYHRDSG